MIQQKAIKNCVKTLQVSPESVLTQLDDRCET